MLTVRYTVIALLLAIASAPTESSARPEETRKSRTCGTTNDLARRSEICAKPVMDIIEGTLEVWPRTLNDTANLCEQIHGAEKCIRDESRRCAQGLHKTITSTLATSVMRSRKRECSKDKHPAILRMVNCIEAHSGDTRKMIAGIVTRMNIVETQMTDLTEKTNGVCCTIKNLETELKTLFDRICPQDTQTVLRLYNAVIEDVYGLVCRGAKCVGDIYKGYKITQVDQDTGKVIATVLRIVFSLGE